MRIRILCLALGLTPAADAAATGHVVIALAYTTLAVVGFSAAMRSTPVPQETR